MKAVILLPKRQCIFCIIKFLLGRNSGIYSSIENTFWGPNSVILQTEHLLMLVCREGIIAILTSKRTLSSVTSLSCWSFLSLLNEMYSICKPSIWSPLILLHTTYTYTMANITSRADITISTTATTMMAIPALLGRPSIIDPGIGICVSVL